MYDKYIPPLLKLPVELIYRILDNLNDLTILCSMRDVCSRINTIVDSYHQYQVRFSFVSIPILSFIFLFSIANFILSYCYFSKY